jgi:hypothetical protein
MPIEFGIWRVSGEKTTPVKTSALENEARLEAILQQDPAILGLDVLLIVGRQVITTFGTRADLLAIDSDGMLYIIEVKKARTPRDVVAQALDYGYWIEQLSIEDVAEIYAHHHDGETFEAGFHQRFDESPPETLSDEHQLVIVASSLDPQTDRIVRYVRDRGVPINVVFFQYFRDGEQEFLARTWDVDPVAAGAPPAARKPMARKPKAPWNGQDFYVGFGEDSRRSWDDAIRYGFVSAGGGKWYSQTLQSLFVGARVFAYIPQTGYVGVGTVTETVQPVTDFKVKLDDGREVPILEAPLTQPGLGTGVDDDEQREYLVRVEWQITRHREQAFREKGMFANQNTVVRLRDPFTLERLTELFGLDGPSADDGQPV